MIRWTHEERWVRNVVERREVYVGTKGLKEWFSVMFVG
jgi:hypothetical protein